MNEVAQQTISNIIGYGINKAHMRVFYRIVCKERAKRKENKTELNKIKQKQNKKK